MTFRTDAGGFAFRPKEAKIFGASDDVGHETIAACPDAGPGTDHDVFVAAARLREAATGASLIRRAVKLGCIGFSRTINVTSWRCRIVAWNSVLLAQSLPS